MIAPRADVAVIGGTGFYSFLDDARAHVVETPYGPPSGPLRFGTVAGRDVAFIPRNGPAHEHSPHRIPCELRQCHASIALVTDMDAGVDTGEGVGQADVFALFARNLERLTTILTDTIRILPDPIGCSCSAWADETNLTYDVPGTFS